MPVSVKKQGKKFRVVEKSGKIAKNAAGTAVDGGGHSSKAGAVRQVRAINSKNKEKGK